MSGQATGWVLRHGPHPEHVDRDGRAYGQRARGLRSVLTTVADAANAEGRHAHPGIDGVMRGSLYGRRQAIDLLATLVEEGWLTVEQEGGGRAMATVYRVNMVPRNGATVAPPPPERVQSDERNGAICTPETVQSGTETVHSGLHPNGLDNKRSNGREQQPPLAPAGAEVFEVFWGAYPRKTAKAEALKAWKLVTKTTDPRLIIESVVRYREDPNLPPPSEQQYIPHPSTWLRGQRWQDGPLPPRSTPRPGAKGYRPPLIDTDRTGPSRVLTEDDL